MKTLDELLGGLVIFPGQIGGIRASGGRGVIRLKIVVEGYGKGIENNDVVAVDGIFLVAVEAVFGVESKGLVLGLFHKGKVRRKMRRGEGSVASLVANCVILTTS